MSHLGAAPTMCFNFFHDDRLDFSYIPSLLLIYFESVYIQGHSIRPDKPSRMASRCCINQAAAIDLALSQRGPSSEINAANCGVNGQASDVLLRGPSSLNPSMCLLHLFSNSHFTLSLCHNVYSHTHENALSTAYWPPLCPRALHPGPHQDHHAFQTPRCSQ